MTKITDILAGMPLDESTKEQVKAVWESSLSEAKVAQEATLREEYATRYETDVERMTETMSKFLETRLAPHVQNLKEGHEEVSQIKAKYAAKINKIQATVKEQMDAKLSALAALIEQKLGGELAELREDVDANRRATIKTLNEAKASLEADREKLRKRAAAVLENIVTVKVENQIRTLREDIEAARKDSFGREIFEAFSMVFRRQFFDSSSEFKKLISEAEVAKASEEKTKRLAARAIHESRETAKKAQMAAKKLEESVKREKEISRLLQPLKGSARSQMATILESTKTDRLNDTFRKFLPTLVRESSQPAAPKKARAVEIRSGSQALNESEYEQLEGDDLSEIRRLSGLR